ncbi:MAG TPA: hypothetical protein VJL89_04735, partial [Thermodesulfovibrionia bacterium]|nr:hypothetical protein [Thermodesulfovibrionia bacterium]
HRFQVCLHGHIHEAQKKFYDYDNTRGIHIIGAGTFSAPAHEQVTGIPHQYNLLVCESGKIKLYTRKKEKLEGAWSGDRDDKNDPKPCHTFNINFEISDDTLINKNLSALKSLVSNISEEELKNAYRASLPKAYNFLSKSSFSIDEVIKQLNDIPPQSDGTLPVLTFAWRAAAECKNNETANKLRRWTEQMAALNECDLEVIKEAKTIKFEKAGSIYLLAKLSQHQNNNCLFEMKICTWKNADEKPIIEQKDNCTIDEARQLLDKCIAFKMNEDDKIETVEIFLPPELILHQDVDQWPMEATLPFKETLGYEYKTFVRFVRPYRMKKQWEEKWELFQNNGGNFDDSAAWFCQKDYCVKSLYENLKCPEQRASSLMMTYLPDESPEATGPAHAILQAGVAVVLCFRNNWENQKKSDDIKDYFQSLLEDNTLFDLPVIVYSERKNAKKQDDFGKHLTLIWDNPERTFSEKERLLTP